MNPKNALRLSAVALSAFVLASCADSPQQAPTSPAASANLNRSAAAQDRLEALFQKTSPEVMGLPGTVFADNDEVAGKLVIGVENENAANGVRAVLARMGVAEADYAIEKTAPIQFAATLQSSFSPKVAGIQIHFTQYLCTLGFNVDHAGGRSFITNSHCTATQGGTEGTKYYQPTSSVDPTVIATEVDDPLFVKNGPGCPKGKKCRYSDASRALYSAGINNTRGDIAKPTAIGSLTWSGSNFAITAQDNSSTSYAVGTVMNKVGRTTGWSQGPVSRTCVNTSVSGSTVYLFCQTFVTANVDHGDSGSPVFTISSGDNVTLRGILWGGASDNSYFVMSPLSAIQSELGAVTATK